MAAVLATAMANKVKTLGRCMLKTVKRSRSAVDEDDG